MKTHLALDPFYLIVDSDAWLARLVPLGVKLVQLRIKNQPITELRRQIRQAQALCRQYDCQLVINDYWQLALELGCDYVHLGQEDVQTADLAALRQAGLSLGVSTHSPAELDIALQLDADYIALGPIYPTQLKAMPWQPQGLARLHEWQQQIDPRPLVAIGGISAERAPLVLQAGADSAAVVTDICRAADPEAQTRSWLAATAPWRKPRLTIQPPQGADHDH